MENVFSNAFALTYFHLELVKIKGIVARVEYAWKQAT